MSLKKSILFVSAAASWPLTDGKRQRTWFLIEALSKLYNVDFLFIGFESEKKTIEQQSKNYRKLFFIKKSKEIPLYPDFLLSKTKKSEKKRIQKKIEELLINTEQEEYSFIFSRYLDPLFLIPINKNIKVVCDLDDVFYEAFKSRIKNEHNYFKKLKLFIHYHLSLAQVEKLIRRIDLSFIVKESDRNYKNLQNAVCLPNLPFGYYINDDLEDKTITSLQNNQPVSIGFIGKLSYRPNYQSLINFINKIWKPIIKSGFSGQLIIAGSGDIPSSLVHAIKNSDNILFLGFVNKATDFWNKIDALIVPVDQGGGTNIKIAEAFMNGKKVIASPFSSRGYEEFIKEGDLLVAKNKNKWFNSINKLNKADQLNPVEISFKAKQRFDLNLWNQNLLSHLNTYS